jgi:signal transduction histidine kinase
MTTPVLAPQAGTHPERVPARGRLALRVLAVRDSLSSLARHHPLVADAALAAALLAVSVPPVTRFAGSSHTLSAALVVAVVTPLAWRRRAPLLVLAVIIVPALAQLFTGQQISDYLAILVALYTVGVLRPAWQALAAAAALEAGVVLAFTRMRVPGGLWALASASTGAAGLLGYYVRTTRQAHLVAQAERAERLERERDQQAQLAVSAERGRIAREMHDIVAHHIAVMTALAEGAAYTAKADPGQAATLMSQVSDTGRTALTEMRRLLGVLRQPATQPSAPQPALADLGNLLATTRAAGLRASLDMSGQVFPLPPSAQLAIYRMVQEALTNTLKHAPGASAQVRLSYQPGAIELEVTDDGAAAGPPVPGTSGHGLAGMRERAAVFGGQVTAGPRPGGGWRVHAALQLDPSSGDILPTAMTESP